MIEQPSSVRILAFPDHLGRLRVVYVFRNAASMGFDGSSISWFSPIERSDVRLKVDQAEEGLIFGDPADSSGRPLDNQPRHILRKVLSEAREMGFEVRLGFEPEFFLVRRGETGIEPADSGEYFSLPPKRVERILLNVVREASELGISVLKFHHEVSPGQYEIVPEGGDPMAACDAVVALRALIKRSAEDHGLTATFMPKPFSGLNGSGMHVHVSLLSVDNGKNVFGGADGPTKVALSFIAGLLRRTPEITAVAAPTVNSYKRLVPGHEAPVYISWGRSNRSTLIRIPWYSGTFERVEFRVPDASCSPHLVAALIVAAGLEGIKENIEPPPESLENVYSHSLGLPSLPKDPDEAARELAKSTFARGVLTDDLVERISSRLLAEWEEYGREVGEWEKTRLTVSPWEVERYLNVGA